MLKLGEIKRGKDIGFCGNKKFIWASCMDCGKERWVAYCVTRNEPEAVRCYFCSRTCSRKKKFDGGRTRDIKGYVLIKLEVDNFFLPTANKQRYILEHRLIMAKHLGRNLHSWEIVHHKNGIKDDNHIENLQIVSEMQHNEITLVKRELSSLKNRIILLEAENALLEHKIKTQMNSMLQTY